MYTVKKALGVRIKKLRSEQGWSQEELAHRAKINRTYVGQIERGEKSATIDSLYKIVSALNITMEELFKNLQPATEYKDNNTLSSIIDLLNTLNIENQEVILDIMNSLLRWNNKQNFDNK